MTFQQIQYIAAVAHYQSMNKAAQHLFVSQPTLSQAIKDLETEIGITIFERSRQGVSLTEDGIEFLRLSKNILSELDHLQEHYVAKNSASITHFQVSGQHYAFVVDAFIKFIKSHGDKSYVFNLKETFTLGAIDDVYNRKSSLGVIFMTENNKNIINQILKKKELEFYPCHSVKPHVFLSSNHPLAKRKTIEEKELKDYPMVTYEYHGEEALAEDLVFNDESEQKIFVHDRGTMMNVIANTDAYNIGTGYLISKIIPDEIVSIPLEGNHEEMCLGWVHLKEKKVSFLTKQFVDIMVKSLKDYSPDRK